MQHTLESLEAFKRHTDDRVCAANPSEDDSCEPVYDGVMNPSEFLRAPVKILWILKEPYDDFNSLTGKPEGGGWTMSDLIPKFKRNEGFGKTWRRIVYASWGILHNAEDWQDIPDFEDDPDVVDALEQIAYINVKKMIGRKTSPHDVIQRAYNEHKTLLHEQIDTIDPNVVIFGGTVCFFEDAFNLGTETGRTHASNAVYWQNQDRLYIDAYHPAYFQRKGLNDKAYCWDIISIVRDALAVTPG